MQAEGGAIVVFGFELLTIGFGEEIAMSVLVITLWGQGDRLTMFERTDLGQWIGTLLVSLSIRWAYSNRARNTEIPCGL